MTILSSLVFPFVVMADLSDGSLAGGDRDHPRLESTSKTSLWASVIFISWVTCRAESKFAGRLTRIRSVLEATLGLSSRQCLYEETCVDRRSRAP